jgi:hypothetical protein
MEEKKEDDKPAPPRDKSTGERLRDAERSLKQEDNQPGGILQSALDFLHRKR